jgi:hypothetical protein
MTTRPTLSLRQLDTLEAIAEFEVSKPDQAVHGYHDFETWRISGDGPAVTVQVDSLLRKGLAVVDDTPTDGRWYAILTDAGRELLAELASRAPAGKDRDADPS